MQTHVAFGMSRPAALPIAGFFVLAWFAVGGCQKHATENVGREDTQKAHSNDSSSPSTSASNDVLANRPIDDGITRYSQPELAIVGGKWQSSKGGKLSLDEGQQALTVKVGGTYAGVVCPVDAEGSHGLKLALHMKSDKIRWMGVNVFDQKASDNTTAYGFRKLRGSTWTPIVYHLDRFRYNSASSGRVGANCVYRSLEFWSPPDAPFPAEFSLTHVVLYRGQDNLPPAPVEHVIASSHAQGVTLRWDNAADNVGTMTYAVSRKAPGRDFEKIAETTSTEYTDGHAPQGKLEYRVLAVDFEENLGAWSDPVGVNVTDVFSSATFSQEEQDRVAYADNVRRIHGRGGGKVRKGHVFLFGDSLTGASGYQSAVPANLLNLTVDATGYAGQQTSFAVQKIDQELQSHNPEFMLILFGTNNSKDANAVRAAMNDLRTIATKCMNHGTVPVLGTIPPRGFQDHESKPEANFNRELKSLCRELQIPTAYIFEEIQAGENRKQFIAGDGVHWTAQGMELAGSVWGRTMDHVRFVLRDHVKMEVASESAAAVSTVADSTPASAALAHKLEPEQTSGADHLAETPRPSSATQEEHRIRVTHVQELTQALEEATEHTVIQVDPGDYELSRPLSIRTPFVTLRGTTENRDDVVLHGTGMGETQIGVALAIDASNVTVANLTIGRVGLHGIQVRGENGVHQFLLDNVRIFDTGQQLLKGSTAYDAAFSENCTVRDCLFEYTGGAPSNDIDAIEVLQGGNWLVQNSVFRNIHGPQSDGWVARPAVLFWRMSRDTVIEGNVFINCYRNIAIGFTNAASFEQRDVVTDDNLYFDHERGSVRHNVIWNSSQWSQGGIEINACRDAVVEHNTVITEGEPPWSISVRFLGSSATVRNNLTNKPLQERDAGHAEISGNVVKKGLRAVDDQDSLRDLAELASHEGAGASRYANMNN